MALPKPSRDAVLQAMREFDELGRDAFLEKYGFWHAKYWFLVQDGKEYDSKAIYGVAVGIDDPERGVQNNFSGGESTVVRRLRSLGFEVRNTNETSNGEVTEQAWIFQSNPQFFDIASAVRSLPEMNWTVAQGRNLLHAGHHVYIWQSGADGGVIAEGTVLTEPAMLPDQEGQEFIRDAEKFEGEQLRVRLSIDHVLDSPLSRNRLKDHPVLRNLGILRFANATNYNISAEEDTALQDLISSGESADLSSGGRVWWVNQGAHYQEERDGQLIWAPLVAKNGHELSHWTSMRDAKPEDRILHYANGRIRAVSTIETAAEEAPRPAGLSEEAWGEHGRLIKTRYVELAEPVALEEIPSDWRIAQGGPFTRQGAVQQGYFYLLSADFVNKIAGAFPKLGLEQPEETQGASYEEPSLQEIGDAVRASGLAISDKILRRYHVSLKTRGFVILSGVSGTGKSWLASEYADAVGANYLLQPVAPNWTTNEDLLGYLNPIRGTFSFTPFSQFLRDASAEYESAQRQGRSARPFHVTLDEMNLARVEYYFAKFLSSMEVRAREGTAELELAPGTTLLLTPNLFFSGTVNVDETTKGFSDKVYDRAQLLELPVDPEALRRHISGKPYEAFLMEVWEHVHPVAPFAFRTLDEIESYCSVAEQLNVSWQEALDEQLLQKVLPKFKGGELAVQDALEWLVGRTADEFPLTQEKSAEMLAYCQEHGFTDYFA